MYFLIQKMYKRCLDVIHLKHFFCMFYKHLLFKEIEMNIKGGYFFD